jgi:hypothetical protein
VVTVEGYLIVPLVMGRSMDLNATTVMIACLFWDLVWGFPGLFLAMPIMAGIRAICLHTPGLRAWAYLMSTERSIKAWQQEERAATMAVKKLDLNPDSDATVVMEDVKEALGEMNGPPTGRGDSVSPEKPLP